MTDDIEKEKSSSRDSNPKLKPNIRSENIPLVLYRLAYEPLNFWSVCKSEIVVC